MTEFTDDYFRNLTMDFDNRDDEIYPQWALWCEKSNGKYFIDGKDGYFYTHERTQNEMEEENRHNTIMSFLMCQRPETDENGNLTTDWTDYETYIHNFSDSDEPLENILDFNKWKISKN